MKYLDMFQRLMFFFVGYTLGVHIGKTNKTDLQIFFLQISVYTILIIIYFVAKAVAER